MQELTKSVILEMMSSETHTSQDMLPEEVKLQFWDFEASKVALHKIMAWEGSPTTRYLVGDEFVFIPRYNYFIEDTNAKHVFDDDSMPETVHFKPRRESTIAQVERLAFVLSIIDEALFYGERWAVEKIRHKGRVIAF